jgi:hypothetical protein
MTAEQFFDVFRAYNESVWPAPLAWSALAAIAVFVALRPRQGSDRGITLFLAALWAWAAVAYLMLHLAPHNPLAWLFGALFLAQSAILVEAAVHDRLRFSPRMDAAGIAGGVLVVYALVVYPLLGRALGHIWPAAPTFGVPCPTTLFTFGMLLWTSGRVRVRVLVIPALWAFTAVGAAVGWGVLEDLAMPIAAVGASFLLVRRNRRLA